MDRSHGYFVDVRAVDGKEICLADWRVTEANRLEPRVTLWRDVSRFSDLPFEPVCLRAFWCERRELVGDAGRAKVQTAFVATGRYTEKS